MTQPLSVNIEVCKVLLLLITLLQADSTLITAHPGFGLSVQYPKVFEGRFDSIYVTGVVALTEHKVDSIYKAYEDFIMKGGELQGDAESPETSDEFRERKEAFQLSITGQFFDEFKVIRGTKFGLRRYRSEPCGCYIVQSYTFIDSVRLGMFAYTFVDTLESRIREVMPYYERDFHHLVEYQKTFFQAVIDSLKTDHRRLLRSARIQRKK